MWGQSPKAPEGGQDWWSLSWSRLESNRKVPLIIWVKSGGCVLDVCPPSTRVGAMA